MPLESVSSRRQEWENNYKEGFKPWDTGIVPPEVRLFWENTLLQPDGIALDLGCGTGTNVRYLASLGLRVIGFDLAQRSLLLAMERSGPDYVELPHHFVQTDASTLPLNGIGASYILDVGCLHTIPKAARSQYAAGVAVNLRPGGYYQLYAHDPPEPDSNRFSADHGLLPHDVEELFSPQLILLTTVQGDSDSRKSHWYLLHKPA